MNEHLLTYFFKRESEDERLAIQELEKVLDSGIDPHTEQPLTDEDRVEKAMQMSYHKGRAEAFNYSLSVIVKGLLL